MESRVQRFALQSMARAILPESRTAKCLRIRAHDCDVQVWKSREHGTASYGGLQTCGSVWTCPVCAAKIAERRRIKLLGIAKRRQGDATKRTPDGVELRVHPTLVPAKRLIANVEGAMNAVMVQGDAVGTTLYYGKGAGSEPTASAVIADLVDITRLHTADPDHRVPHLAFQAGELRDTPVLPIDQVRTAFYLRLRVADQKGVLSSITSILAASDISIDAVLQRESNEGEHQTDVIILTHETQEGAMRAALAQMQALPTVLAPIVSLRKEELA